MNTEKILALAAAQEEHMTAVRRELHKHPEMGWHEERTTDVIERELRAMGLTNIRRGFRGTNCGLICDIGEARPRIAIRADIDALAVAFEDNDLEFKSEVSGVMADTYEAISADLPEDKVAETGKMQLTDFIDPAVAEPFIQIQAQFEESFAEEGR